MELTLIDGGICTLVLAAGATIYLLGRQHGYERGWQQGLNDLRENGWPYAASCLSLRAEWRNTDGA